ncbi:hypothetical protein Tco_0236217 [Tanacetum coccineum]
MRTYLKNMEGYKLKDLKLKEFDYIQEMFDRAFKRVNTFEDFRTELVEGKEKRARTELIQEIIKKQKGDLKTMFKPHVEDKVLRKLTRNKELNLESVLLLWEVVIVIYNMHYKIHTFTQSGMSLAEYYHKFNSQWRQYDSLVDLPKYTCDTIEKLKSHEQLIRLMQFLMVLDDVFSNVRSSILITEPLPDVKFAYATLSGDESHRVNNVHTMVNKMGTSTAFVSKSNNEWSANRPSQNNQNKRFNRGPNPNLVYKHCNLIGHTVDRCFKLIGYPVGFKKNSKGNNNNTKANVNNVTTCGSSNSHMLTSDEYQKLMGLLRSSGSNTACNIGNVTGASQHMTYFAMFLFNVRDVSHLNIIVAYPNGTVAKVKQLASANKQNVVFNEMDCLIQDSTQNYLVGTGSITGGLYFLDQVLKDKIGLKDFESSPCDVCHKAKQTREPFPMSDHKTSVIGELVHLDVWGPYRVKCMEDKFVIHPASTKDKTVHDPNILENSNPTGSIIADEVSEQLDATSDDEKYDSKGEEFGKFDLLFGSNEGNPESTVGDSLRRSSRNTSLPDRLNNYELQGKFKYGLNRYVSYANLSSENYSFVTNFIKTIEPKTYREASTDEK